MFASDSDLKLGSSLRLIKHPLLSSIKCLAFSAAPLPPSVRLCHGPGRARKVSLQSRFTALNLQAMLGWSARRWSTTSRRISGGSICVKSWDRWAWRRRRSICRTLSSWLTVASCRPRAICAASRSPKMTVLFCSTTARFDASTKPSDLSIATKACLYDRRERRCSALR
jgi:hypothetical protein